MSLDFGFLFCRVSAHYGIRDTHLLEMPVKRFWLFSECIDRMHSAEDIRAIRVAASVQDQASYDDSMSKLRESVGEVATYEGGINSRDERDPNATSILKSLM